MLQYKEPLNSKLIEVGDHITKVAKMLIEKHNLSNDIDACMEKLGTLGKCGYDFNRTRVNFGLGMQEQGHNERFRMVKRRFQHSTETIHRCFHEVLNAMMSFAREIIVPSSSDAITNTSKRHRRLKQIFPRAIGALDGTIVHAVMSVDQQTRYRGRGEGECYQNVLAICDFDIIFTFVWVG
ncbi:hypothetical protein E3N88_30789 [Mikania micrantha]|uniref:DUF8040 domain-containing protein n=1 Tax=Mikania micrantha TaxID=192012 RepID=A0A5N6MML8_9ASTR|nr:hypothetical protein E3N88_30789 [Mikania micrantha]